MNRCSFFPQALISSQSYYESVLLSVRRADLEARDAVVTDSDLGLL